MNLEFCLSRLSTSGRLSTAIIDLKMHNGSKTIEVCNLILWMNRLLGLSLIHVVVQDPFSTCGIRGLLGFQLHSSEHQWNKDMWDVHEMFYRPGIRVAYITFSHILLATAQSNSHAWLPGVLRSISVCPEGEMSFGRQPAVWVPFPSLHSDNRY